MNNSLHWKKLCWNVYLGWLKKKYMECLNKRTRKAVGIMIKQVEKREEKWRKKNDGSLSVSPIKRNFNKQRVGGEVNIIFHSKWKGKGHPTPLLNGRWRSLGKRRTYISRVKRTILRSPKINESEHSGYVETKRKT